MIEFIISNDGAEKYFTILKMIIETSNKLRIAIPYWGDGAVEMLGLAKMSADNVGRTKIICSLESGACNPHEIKRMLDSNFLVYSNPKLHAKIAISDKNLVVGSANASANGLGFEGVEINRMLEAGIKTDDRNAIIEAQEWFSAIEQSNETWIVKTADPRFVAAMSNWESRRNSRFGISSNEFWANLANRGIWIEIVRFRDADDEAERENKRIQKATGDLDISFWQTRTFNNNINLKNILLIAKLQSKDQRDEEGFLSISKDIKPHKIKRTSCYFGKYVEEKFGTKFDSVFFDKNREKFINFTKSKRKYRFSLDEFIKFNSPICHNDGT